MTDALGNTKQYQYDRVNRLIAVIDEAGNKTSYGYDALDNITKVTDALKQVTRYTYDKNGNLLTETDALGNSVEYTYTPEGWLSAITKADGTVLTFAYDKTGNLLTQNTGENQNIESSYNEIGQVATVTSSEGTITYQYNQQGYLVSVTNGNGDVVSYTYDQYGNKLSMTYPDGRVVSYTYDGMNRMTSVIGLDGEVTTYAYDAAGQPVETASRNLTTEYKYDVVGSLVEQTTTGSSNLSFQYSYNLNGYITGEVRTENGETITSAYVYDPLGELASFTQSTGYGEQYTYDKAGNMTQKVITPLGSVPNEKGTVENAVTLKMKYNQGNQLVSMANGGDKITYKYDKNGSMVEKALTSKQYGTLTDTYAYNSLDQLVSYAGYDGYQQQFAYDANGMRLSKSEFGNSNRSTLEELLRGEIAGLPEVVVPVAASEDEAAVPAEYEWATTEYLYDITQEYYQVIQQTTTSGNTTATTAYAYGLERIAAYDANNTTQYIYDGRGSVAQTISAPVAGASVSATLPEVEVHSYSYTAFGEQMGAKASGFGYNAEDFDAGTGMINLRMRQYEPFAGKFYQKDKAHSNIFTTWFGNRYCYVQNSPVVFVDSSGLRLALGASVENDARMRKKDDTTMKYGNYSSNGSATNAVWKAASLAYEAGSITSGAMKEYERAVNLLETLEKSELPPDVKNERRRSIMIHACNAMLNHGENAPIGISVAENGNEVNIDFSIAVSGEYMNSEIEGSLFNYPAAVDYVPSAAEYWRGEYQLYGETVYVQTSASVVDVNSQEYIPDGEKNHIMIWLNSEAGIPHADFIDTWNAESFKTIEMYPVDSRSNHQYSQSEYLKTLAHELGHALGLDDGYPDLDGNTNRPESPNAYLSIMQDQFDGSATVNNVDLMMVIMAQIENKPQYYENYGSHSQSLAVIYNNIEE